MGLRIAVGSWSLGAGFSGLMAGEIRRQLRPDQTLVEGLIPARTPDEFQETRWLALLQEPKPHALLGICCRPGPRVIAACAAARIPVVLIDEEAEGASTVSGDNFAGGRLAGEHLARVGRKSLAIVSGELHVNGGYNALQRAKGFAKALADLGLLFELDEAVQVVEYTHRDGVQAMKRILGARRKLDGIFCAAGDATATGLLAEAQSQGVKVPEQIAVVGYDDSPLAAISRPPLTTVRQSAEKMAAEALKLASLATAEILVRPRKVLLPPELVVRRSA